MRSLKLMLVCNVMLQKLNLKKEPPRQYLILAQTFIFLSCNVRTPTELKIGAPKTADNWTTEFVLESLDMKEM